MGLVASADNRQWTSYRYFGLKLSTITTEYGQWIWTRKPTGYRQKIVHCTLSAEAISPKILRTEKKILFFFFSCISA